MDSVCIGLTSSNSVTFAENSTGLGSACQPTRSGWTCPNPTHPQRSTLGYIDSDAQACQSRAFQEKCPQAEGEPLPGGLQHRRTD